MILINSKTSHNNSSTQIVQTCNGPEGGLHHQVGVRAPLIYYTITCGI